MGRHCHHTSQVGGRGGLHRQLAGVGHTGDEMRAHLIVFRLGCHNDHLCLAAGRHVHLGAAGADGRDGILHRLHSGFCLREVQGVLILRPLGGDQIVTLVGQRLPDLLGNEGHERMQQLHDPQQHVAQHVLGGQLGSLVLAVETGLGQLDIPVAVGVPDEVVDLGGGHAQLIRLQIVGDLADQRIQAAEHPLVLQLQLLRQLHLVDGQVHHHEAAGVPDLIGEVAHSLALLHKETHIVAGAVAGNEVETQSVSAVLLRHLQRVDAIAQGLGHFAALVVADQTVDKHRLERLLLHLLHAGEDHARHPEEDDIVARDHDGGGIPVLQVGRVGVRPAQRGERPQRGAEPGVQHVLLAGQVGAAALFALGGIFTADVDVAALVAVPRGDLMTPPQLAGDAPVVDVLHPVDIRLGEALGHELDGAVLHHADGFLGQRRHLHEPLGRDQRLHVVVAAVAGAHIVAVRLRLDQIAVGLQIGHHRLAAGVAIHALIFAGVFVHGAVVADAADDLQIVPQAHLEVVGVMGGGHLHGAGTEADLAVIVAHDGDLAVHNGQDAGLADQVLELLVLRVDRNARIAHHRLRTGGGDDDIAAAVGERVADIPEVARLVDILDLRVGERRQAVRAPVDDAAALVDQALIVELAERLAHGLGAALVHREAGAGPVTARAHLLLLLDDAVAVLFLPFPHALKELLAAEVVAGQALLGAQLLLDLNLRGDARVVGAGEPQRLIALHPLEAGQDVLQRAVQRVSHVELAGDVGRRHDDGKGLLIGIRLRLEAVAVHPQLVNAGFHVPRVVDLGQFFHICTPYLVFGKTKSPLRFASAKQGEHTSVVPPVFGIAPALMGAATPRPGNGGHTVAAYCRFSAKLRDDLGGASRALTPAAPSLGIR